INELLLVQPGALATRDTLLDRVEHLLIVERLGEELERASLHGANGHRDIGASGDEYDRQFEAEFGQFLLQLEPAEIREVNVKHQTVSILQAIVTQALCGGSKRLHMQASSAGQPRQGDTNGHIVVNDEHLPRTCVHISSVATAGTTKRTVVPKSGFAVAQSRPPHASTIPRQIARPMPIPSRFVVKNGSKIRARCWGSIPAPESVTATSTCCPSLHCALMGTLRGRSFVPAIYSTAFVMRLTSTCCNCTRSARTRGTLGPSLVSSVARFVRVVSRVNDTTSSTISLTLKAEGSTAPLLSSSRIRAITALARLPASAM